MTLPECLINTIGIVPCEPPAVEVQLHDLSELEGLSLSSIAATADPAKFASARAEVEALVPIGIKKTLFRLKSLMSQRYGAYLQREIDTGEFCYFGTTKQAALTAGDQGLQIQRNLVLQPQIRPIRVNWVTVKSPNLTVNIPLKIKNEAGTVLWETTIATLPADTEFQVPVNQDFYENKIRIVVEGSALQGYYAHCDKGQACCGELGYSNLYSLQNTAFYVNGIEAGTVGGFKSPGLTANVTLPCSDSLFCQYREQLAPAFLYDTGIQILKEWQASSRMNVFALKKEWVEKKITEWEAEAEEKTEAVLPYIYDSMMKCFPRCFECKQPVGFMPAIP